MNSKLIGSILLIVGTSIGGGMLALPMANAASGLIPSSIALILCWLLMTLGALLILEVNLYLPPGKHMVSMAQKTLGIPGLVITWISYLLLLYTLLAAYISGGSDVLSGILSLIHVRIENWQSTALFTLSFGAIVYGGISRVDYANRALMFMKLGIYVFLVIFIAPFVQLEHWTESNPAAVPGSLMILITSFGFAIIVPNLRDYFEHDLLSLKRVIIIGSLIPLVCYFAWDAVIMGTLDAEGTNGLISLTHDMHPTTSLANQLAHIIHSKLIDVFFRAFTSVCMLTAFLGVALCLMSFLSDGLNLARRGKQGFILALITFTPPFLLVLYFPGAYLSALSYAGILCVILLLILPALMALAGRKRYACKFVVPGGAWTPVFILVSSVGLLYFSS
ncbi:MAG: aromatic amino acid transport family protein [Legionellaceae bacterium]|nr:aromatic amino acid transport family protein [Legionellaceae bacterium]